MTESQENFRLIGIRPHNECSTVFTKVLTKGRLYKFYNEYSFYNSKTEVAGDGDVIVFYCKNARTVPNDLYKVNDLNINIAAIVGRNGSGKSTLIELILYCIYKLGTTLRDEKGETVLRPYFDEILDMIDANEAKIKKYEYEKNELLSCFETLKDIDNLSETDYVKILEMEKSTSEFLESDLKIKNVLTKQALWEKQKADSKDEHDFIHDNLKCSIYFEINDVLWEFNTVSGFYELQNLVGQEEEGSAGSEPDAVIRNMRILTITDPESLKILYSFFYSIILNYSHYSLNSNSLGYWITTLFHKNDGYRTPAVINPMRTEGIIDINNENELAKARLLSNVLVEAFHKRSKEAKIKLTDKQHICKVRFSLNIEKREANKTKQVELNRSVIPTDPKNYKISDIQNAVNIIMELLPHYFKQPVDFFDLQRENIPFVNDACNYLVIKVYKVLKKYKEYESFAKREDYVTYIRKVLDGLKGDKSHVLFKIERTLHYLSRLYDKNGLEFWGAHEHHADFDLYELLDWMQITEEEDLQHILSRIPPSIFKIDFVLDSLGIMEDYSMEELEKLPKFTDLSSGEQQKIHIINGVVYHLNNIYSIHNSNAEIERIKYHYVNVVFDEIELYFHPDLQKEFIYDLLENIKRLVYITRDSKKRIKGLNFIFATHSPFILSDIPIQNILKLQYDEVSKTSVQLGQDRQTFAANIHDLLANNFFFKEKMFIGKKANEYLKKLIQTITDLKRDNEKLTYDQAQVLQQKALLIGESFFREKLLEMIREQSELSEEERIDMLLIRKRKEIDELEKQKKK